MGECLLTLGSGTQGKVKVSYEVGRVGRYVGMVPKV